MRLAPTTPQRGIYTRQGLGYYENTQGDSYGANFDTQKTFNFLGQHSLTFGYRYEKSSYDGNKNYTGFRIPVDQAYVDQSGAPNQAIADALLANGTTASYYLRTRGSFCGVSAMVIPGLNGCGDGTTGVTLIQVRGEFGNLNFNTKSLYHTVFAQDAWSPSKYITINAGMRWEQQHVQGVNAAYTFNDNWSPRVGVSVDPWGNRKTKITANFGRYTEALPLDIAIRSLSAEYDSPSAFWSAPNDGAGNALVNPDGTLDFTNFSTVNNFENCGGLDPTGGSGPCFFNGGISAQSSVAFGKGTRSEYLDEYQLGFEHEFANSGVVFSARYTDRRIKRIIEDNAALSPEAFIGGLAQQYFISNPNKAQDLFTNPIQVDYNSQGADGCLSGRESRSGLRRASLTATERLYLPPMALTACASNRDPMPMAMARAILSPTVFPTASFNPSASTRRWNSKSTRRCRVAGRCARTTVLPSCKATTKVRSATITVRAIRTSARCSISPRATSTFWVSSSCLEC